MKADRRFFLTKHLRKKTSLFPLGEREVFYAGDKLNFPSRLTIGIFNFDFILFIMRAVIQRVKHASCTVDNKITGQIQKGFMILLGVEEADKIEDLKWLGQKFINLRVFEDEQGLMNKSILDIDGSILLISQFTLFAQTKKGNRPSFIRAAKPDKAKPMYEEMAALLGQLLQKEVQLGIFGADMKIELLNDGPVTIIMDTKDKDNF